MQGSRKRILCIDNDEDTRLMISTLLELSGYTVRTSEDVAKGIRLARSERFDLYLLDYYFPDGKRLSAPAPKIISLSRSTRKCFSRR